VPALLSSRSFVMSQLLRVSAEMEELFIFINHFSICSMSYFLLSMSLPNVSVFSNFFAGDLSRFFCRHSSYFGYITLTLPFFSFLLPNLRQEII